VVALVDAAESVPEEDAKPARRQKGKK